MRSLVGRAEIRLGHLDEVQPHDRDRPRSDRASASLRTTWRCTWLSGGTSMTTSPRIRAGAAEPAAGARAAARPRRRARPRSRASECAPRRRDRRASRCSPSLDLDLAAPADPRPPQTESRSTPSPRAASAPCAVGEVPRRPDGVKTTRRCSVTRLAASARRPLAGGAPVAAAAAAPPRRRRRRAARSRRRSARRCPSSRRPPSTALRISSCSGFVIADVIPAAIAIGRNARVEAVAVGQAEADVRGAAGRVDAELLAQPAHEAEHLPPGRSPSRRSASRAGRRRRRSLGIP